MCLSVYMFYLFNFATEEIVIVWLGLDTGYVNREMPTFWLKRIRRMWLHASDKNYDFLHPVSCNRAL